MGNNGIHALLSAAAVSVVMGVSAASAAVVDLYQITVKGTFQSQVDSPLFPASISDPIWSPNFGKTVELTFSMPVNQVPFFLELPNGAYDGEIAGRFEGSELKPLDSPGFTSLFLGGGALGNTVSIFSAFAGDAFGIPSFDGSVSVSVGFRDEESNGVDLSVGLPQDLSPSIFEHQRILFFGLDGTTPVNGFASVDSVSVDIISPTPVPLPASALLLGAGLAALGALRRRKRAA